MRDQSVVQKKYVSEMRETVLTLLLVARVIVRKHQLRLSVKQTSTRVRRVVQIHKSQSDLPVTRERFAAEVKHLPHQAQAYGGFGF